MPTLIQKLSNVLNIIDSGSGDIKETIHLTAKADIKRNVNTPSLIIFESEENENSPSLKFTPDLMYQDEGGSPTTWAGTIDDLVNKLNNEYLVQAVASDPLVITELEAIKANTARGNLERLQKEANDLSKAYTFLDVGTDDERISTIVYSGTTVPATPNVTKTFTYSGGSGAYIISNITLS